MTPKETKSVLALLKAAYPNFYKDLPREDLVAAVNLWQKQFEDYDGQAVLNAVYALIAEREEGFPPTIGAVKQQAARLYAAVVLPESEAWALVSRAARNGAYGWKREFEKLPPLVQKAVGSAEQLRIWAGMEESEVETVVASNFRRSYCRAAEEERARQLLPGFVKASLPKETGLPELTDGKEGNA